ncbi:hypothetical protein OCL90_14310 [Enterococcus faecalis]|uniref:hypothetical protein n=1 Tax=Enterococcus faecalis TaxID=1351 RepID=UPI0022A7646B|nr:hypothetical protein [Enterococcus faecalis]MCZ0856334.1 hypothetical protein [Enterococcus faecalis]
MPPKTEPPPGRGLQRLVPVGGPSSCHGNCSPVAELNDWCDPDAAAWGCEETGAEIEVVTRNYTRVPW